MDCVVEFHGEIRIRIDGLEMAVERIMELVRRLPALRLTSMTWSWLSLNPW